MSDRLFTPRFFIMCAYSFTVFVSLFQLLPTAPYHVRDLGGSQAASGLFLGLLTFSSAASAPFTGSIGDRVGQRRILIIVSLSLAALVRLHTEFRSRQQRLIFAGLQPQLRDLFVMTRLDRLFELQEDVAAAVRAVGPA